MQLIDLLQTGTIFQGADPHEVSAYVRSHIGAHSLDLHSRSARATLRHKPYGRLGLSHITYGGRVSVHSPGLDQSYHLQLVLDGACAVRYDHLTLHLEPGWATLINPGHAVQLDYSADCVKVIVKLPAPLFNRCCAEQYGAIPEEGVLFAPAGVHVDRNGALFRLLELLYLEADQHQPAESLLGNPMAILVSSKLLELVPHNAQPVPRSLPNAELFERVDEYVDEHAREEITIDQLAALCCVSTRTLYERFRQCKGVVPSAYIKERKLNKIHRQIHHGAHLSRNVTEIALEYGFSHLGRFSSEYRALFGESPSETLRRLRDSAE